MRPVVAIAAKELRGSLRNRWIVAATGLLAVLALALAWLGSTPVGEVGVDRLTVTVVSLTSLSVFLIPMIALLLAYDAVVGEIERGTMLLMLAYPLARWQVVAGKFLGHLAVLGFAALVGYGLAAATLVAAGAGTGEGLRAMLGLMGSTVLLGAAFLALGYLASTVVRERATAAGLALGIWLLLVVVYDLALLAALVGLGGAISQEGFGALLLANPADAFRMLNLTGSEAASTIAGLAGTARAAVPGVVAPLLVLLAWTALPLALTGLLFRRRDI